MAILDLSTITIPTPASYNEDAPFQQLENLAYVLLQILAAAKTAGFVMDDQNFPGLIQATKDLQYNGQSFTFGNLKIEFLGRTATLTP